MTNFKPHGKVVKEFSLDYVGGATSQPVAIETLGSTCMIDFFLFF